MKTRSELHEELCEVLGSRNVYFQPPENLKIKYPCIIYNLDDIDTRRADNKRYITYDRYLLTVVSKDPDCDLFIQLMDRFEMCDLDRAAVADSMNHWYMTLYW